MNRADRGFLVACAIAGAIAIPAHALWTSVSAVVAMLVGYLGLRLWRWSGLPTLMTQTRAIGPDAFLRPAIWLATGLCVGLVVLAAIRLVIEPVVPEAGARIAAAGALPAWRRALIIYVAAVGEETIFRVFLLSLAAGVFGRLVRRMASPSMATAWLANAIAALAFGAVHLPSWMALGHLSAGLAVIVMTLNGAGGLVFGYAFVRRGIAAAIFVHAGADCAIQFIGPLTG